MLRDALGKYDYCMQRRPVLTKSITSAALYGTGDVIAQHIASKQHESDQSATTSHGETASQFDNARLQRALVFGGLFYPGIAHLHYEFLDRLVVSRWRVSAAWVPFTKMVIEQFVYWSYFSNAYYHCVLGALQGFSPRQCYDRVVDTLWDTLKAQWAFWIPAQLVNFRVVPVRYQLNFVLVVSLAWTTFLSLAFPPDNNKKNSRSSALTLNT